MEKGVEVSSGPNFSELGSDADGQDGRDMARMGKKQEFKRSFNWMSSVGFTSCTMGT